MKKDYSIFFVPGIILVGAVMRIPFTTIPTVLSYVADGLGVSVNSLGDFNKYSVDYVCLLFIFGTAFSR